MPWQSNFLAKFRLPGPGPYDLASSDAELAGYYAFERKVLADEKKRRPAEKKKQLLIEMGSQDSDQQGTTILNLRFQLS